MYSHGYNIMIIRMPLWDDSLFFSVSPMDYTELNSMLSFAACETRRCMNVTIVDDLVNEPPELFVYTLERTPGLDTRISLDPIDGRMSITDNDGIAFSNT